ncbi:MAG: hypothetical protein QF516_16465 [Pirellulaceae bacterium]|nr:hypothetical protein [Pirellulaceae bacterium]
MRLRFMGVTPAESVARIDSSIRKMVALADTEQGGDPDFSGVRVDDFIWLSEPADGMSTPVHRPEQRSAMLTHPCPFGDEYPCRLGNHFLPRFTIEKLAVMTGKPYLR